MRGHKWEGGETINLRQFLLSPAPTFVVFSLSVSLFRGIIQQRPFHISSHIVLYSARGNASSSTIQFGKIVHQTQSDDSSSIANEIWRENKIAKHLKPISLPKGKVLVLDFYTMSYTHKAQRVLSEMRKI